MKKALIIVDVQNDFLPGGALAVDDGDAIIPVINRIQKEFDIIAATQDWHPSNHGSFAVNHPGKNPGDTIELAGLPQILWPVHCVQDSDGAAFDVRLDTSRIKRVFRKGTDNEIDSYSGFFDNGHRKDTGLADWLKEQSVDTVYIAGLAADYCVKFTALDAVDVGFKTYLYKNATKAVNLQPDDFDKAIHEMVAAGVQMV
ncbi:MAG: bifunctional nicotinamidase/pyrazinamidase [Cyclobacteriaceae bacterium]